MIINIILSILMTIGLPGCSNSNPNQSRESLIEELNRQKAISQSKVAGPTDTIQNYIPPAGIALTPQIINNEQIIRLNMENSLKNNRPVKLSDLGKNVVYHRMGKFPFGLGRIYPIPGGYLAQCINSLWLLDNDFKQVRALIEEELDIIGTGKGRHIKIGNSLMNSYYNPQTGMVTGIMMDDRNKEQKMRSFIGMISLDNLLQTTAPAKLDIIRHRIKLNRGNYHLPNNAIILPVGEGYFTTGNLNRDLYTFNAKGDTLCRFQIDIDDNTEKVLKGKSVVRNGERNTTYTYKGHSYFRPAYTNKLYRIKDASTLEPVYLIDFGDRQTKQSEGIDVSFDLSGKSVLHSWVETDDLIYIRFTHNYDCPNTRDDKSVKFHQALYNKRTKQLSSFTDFDNISQPGGILNDIDGGPDFWPTMHINGKPYMLTSGKRLKDQTPKEKLDKVPELSDIDDEEIILITIH